MILTIDVGNTNVVLGCVENGEIKSILRLATNTNDLPNDYALKMRQSFEFDGIDYRAGYKVARERARIVDLYVDAGFYARADYNALKPRELAHGRAYSAIYLRNDRGQNCPLELVVIYAVKRKALPHFHCIVVGQVARVGGRRIVDV